MDPVTLQIFLALAMFFTTTFAGLLPIKVLHAINKRKDGQTKKASWCLTLLSCFAGGVFMGTCFLDIIPHVNSNYAKFCTKANWSTFYPFPEFFVCCGFFFVYFLEEISIKVFAKIGAGHGHHHDYSSDGSANCSNIKDANSCPKEPLKDTSNKKRNGHSKLSKNLEYSVSLRKSAVMASIDDKDVESPNDSNEEKYDSIMTHEIVIDESVRYISSFEASKASVLKSLTFVIAMSFHSILEGIALGVQDKNTGIMTLFISLIIHKGIEAFSVGLQISKSNSKRVCMVTLTMIVYGLMTPVGSMMGVLITNVRINELFRDGIVIFLEGLAGGTFIYVTFFEVLAQERANNHSNLIQLNAIVVGFLTVAGMQITENLIGSGHSHGH